MPEQQSERPTGHESVAVARHRDRDERLLDGSLADGIWSSSGARLGEPGQVVDASVQSQIRRPTCVVVTSEAPALNYSGGKVRLTATIEALSVDHDVTVVLRWPEHAGPDLLAAARKFCSERDIPLVYWPSGGVPDRRRWLRRIKGGFGALHPITDRLLQRRVPDSIETLVTNADLLWVVRPGVLTGTAPPDHPAMVLDVDDLIEDVHVTPSVVERFATRQHILVRFNLASTARFSLVCSEQDRRVARIPREIRILPNTASSPSEVIAHGLVGQDPSLAGESDTATPVVLLVGSMNYGPNSEGAEWMGELVWPLVTTVRPDAVLRIVGRSSECLESLGAIRGVEIVGAVDDMAPYLDEAMVSVAPIHRGSGTRVKVLEAFAAGVPVVATTIGAYGIDVRVGTDLHVTDDPVEFAAAIVALLDDQAARMAMGHAGRAVYERNHSAGVFTEHVRAIARDAIADGC